jgi:hypothetical protein
MKIKNIRQSVFETNSSSTHCIVIKNQDAFLIDDSYKKFIENNKIQFTLQENHGSYYQREEVIYLTDKLSYIFSCMLYAGNMKCFNNLQELQTMYIKINNIINTTTGYDIYCKAYNDIINNLDYCNTNISDSIPYREDGDIFYEEIIIPLVNNEEDLKNFLFNSTSVLYMFDNNLSDTTTGILYNKTPVFEH